LGEEEFFVVLALGGVVEEGIKAFGVKKVFQGQACEHTEGSFLEEGFKGGGEHEYTSEAFSLTSMKRITYVVADTLEALGLKPQKGGAKAPKALPDLPLSPALKGWANE
jgi:hypothetical protein